MSLVSVLLFSFITHAGMVELTGVATSLDSKTSLYTEHHRIELDDKGLNKKIETIYKIEGKEFARMTTTFNKNPMVPEVEFFDARFQLRHKFTWLNDKEVQFISDRAGDEKKEKTFILTNNAVVGQGFDNYIKTYFEKLQKGDLPLNYGVLEEMDFFSFTGKAKPSSSPDRLRFGIQLSNPFLRLFVRELELEYDRSRRIQTYRGLSNLLDKNGKAQNVLIKYMWPEAIDAK